ncbi:MAG: bleomycin resistance protein [Chromatiales bacterium]|jgi:catechol 2,3-dioxygenase-like lactoylglutathione lyase family enzyme|nr:bleomycin resistance protein [Chromatiales bacterium]MDP7094068.1 VOC family protein [Gammaproteobacteria bacterium]MDP7269721.1 VOC family protein [Gammaproteobacteria bacterium]HJP05406.1 VOC family protein [Gammaproteobacteria bacterium]
MIKGFHHAAISTPDLEQCVRFYTEVIGGKVAWTFGWPAGTPEADEVTGLQNSEASAAMLKIGETFLEVFEFTSPEPGQQVKLRPVNNHGITHICLEVEDIHAEYERLSAAGMPFNCEPQAQEGSSMVYGRDPDGNVVELIEFTG